MCLKVVPSASCFIPKWTAVLVGTDMLSDDDAVCCSVTSETEAEGSFSEIVKYSFI